MYDFFQCVKNKYTKYFFYRGHLGPYGGLAYTLGVATDLPTEDVSSLTLKDCLRLFFSIFITCPQMSALLMLCVSRPPTECPRVGCRPGGALREG